MPVAGDGYPEGFDNPGPGIGFLSVLQLLGQQWPDGGPDVLLVEYEDVRFAGGGGVEQSLVLPLGADVSGAAGTIAL